MHNPIEQLLLAGRPLVVDGAMSTALEALGCDLNDRLWSAKVLLEAPEKIREVHRQYFRSGANIAITATYQASVAGFAERGLTPEASAEVMRLAVALAREARSDIARETGRNEAEMLVAGSIGPYGAFLADGSEYRGDYRVSKETLRAFHRTRFEALIDAGVDLLAIETQPQAFEIEVLLEMLKETDAAAWVTMTLDGTGTALPDGTPLERVAEMLEACPNVVATGFNCVRRELAGPALQKLAAHTAKPLIVYPNTDKIWDAATKTWRSPTAAHTPGWSHYVPLWQKAGARLIGGCCCTLPSDILSIAKLLGTK